MHVVIPDNDPTMKLLERRAEARGLGRDPKKIRKKLPKLARSLISERLSELQENGDPLAVKAQSS